MPEHRCWPVRYHSTLHAGLWPAHQHVWSAVNVLNKSISVFELNLLLFQLYSKNISFISFSFYRCSERPYPGAEACTCLDCEAACQLNMASPPPLPEEEEIWLILNHDGISVVCLVVFCFATAFLLLGFFFYKLQSRKSLRCKFSFFGGVESCFIKIGLFFAFYTFKNSIFIWSHGLCEI